MKVYISSPAWEFNTFCIPETPKWILGQTVNTQMKCISSGSALLVKVKTIFMDRNMYIII